MELVKSRAPHTRRQAMTGILAPNGARVSLSALDDAAAAQSIGLQSISSLPERALKLGKVAARQRRACAFPA
jgi:hypothetical protein